MVLTMADVHPPEASPLERMPIDVLASIMAFSANLSSLRSAFLSGRVFFHTFNSRKVHITKSILLRSIHPTLLPEALACYEIRRVQWCTFDDVIGEFFRIFKKVKEVRPPRSFQKMIDMLKLHESVEYFATDISTSILARHTLFRCTPLESSSPTSKELVRFQGALYRFEMFHAFFGVSLTGVPDSFGDNSPSALKMDFYSHFSPLEVEQLLCINNLMMASIAPDFNNLIEWDIVCGIHARQYINEYNSRKRQDGLWYVGLFTEAVEEDDNLKTSIREIRDGRLQNDGDDTSEPLDAEIDNDPTSEFTNAEIEELMRIRFSPQDNTAPEVLWLLVLNWADELEYYFPDHLYIFREWGYVMWDSETLLNGPLSQCTNIDDLYEACTRCEDNNNPFREWIDPEDLFRLRISRKEKVKLQREGKDGGFNFDDFHLNAHFDEDYEREERWRYDGTESEDADEVEQYLKQCRRWDSYGSEDGDDQAELD
ncbi:hypothetical protein G7046_g746 [Stylonectria norvegica]|nr:hypothetical protein G7046_g746 [Stylonectria norvegica]